MKASMINTDYSECEEEYNHLRNQIQEQFAKYVLQGINDQKKLSLISGPTSMGKTRMAVQRLTPLYLKEGGCDCVAIAVPQRRQCSDYVLKLMNFAREVGTETAGFTPDEVLKLPTVEDTAELLLAMSEGKDSKNRLPGTFWMDLGWTESKSEKKNKSHKGLYT